MQWHQITANVYDETGRGVNLLPTAISSGDGNVMVGLLPFLKANDPDHNMIMKIMTKAKKDTDVDATMRAACIEMGSVAARRRRFVRSQK